MLPGRVSSSPPVLSTLVLSFSAANRRLRLTVSRWLVFLNLCVHGYLFVFMNHSCSCLSKRATRSQFNQSTVEGWKSSSGRGCSIEGQASLLISQGLSNKISCLAETVDWAANDKSFRGLFHYFLQLKPSWIWHFPSRRNPDLQILTNTCNTMWHFTHSQTHPLQLKQTNPISYEQCLNPLLPIWLPLWVWGIFLYLPVCNDLCGAASLYPPRWVTDICAVPLSVETKPRCFYNNNSSAGGLDVEVSKASKTL